MAGNPLKTFSCPNCGGNVEVRAAGRSLSVVCPNCFSVLDPNSPNYTVLSRFAEKAARVTPVIPLGARGTLRGTQLECIGFMVRSDKSGSFTWDEYLLYNPMQGYRWLVVQNGHCNFVTPLKAPPLKNQSELMPMTFLYQQKAWDKYTDETAVVQFVLGEFYWAVRAGETVRTVDFINPPQMLSFEVSNTEIMASLGEYMPAAEVEDAFKLKGSLGIPFGVAPNQVNPLAADAENIILLTIPFTIGILVLGQWYSYENMFSFMILLYAYVFWFFSRKNGFETSRWENSDYASSHYSGLDLSNLGDD